MAPKLQHIRSTVPHKRPDPALLVDGQAAQNQALESPGMFIKDAAGGLIKVGPTHVGPTAPNSTPAGSAGNSKGEQWVDTSGLKPVLKTWDGISQWLVSGGGATVTTDDVPPAAPADGDLWFRTDVGQLYVWYDDGTSAQWVEANTGSGGGSEWFPSADAGNYTVIGTDGGVYTPTPLDPDLGSPVQLLETNLNLYVATTGNDITGDGTQALPWARPHQAMAYLSKVVLATGVKVTVYVADGNYTFTQPLDLGHPQGTQIFINGTSTTGTRPTGVALNGNGVKGNTAATESFNNTKLQAYYSTCWQFNGCSGLFSELGGGVTLDKILIRGNATANTSGVLAGSKRGSINSASVGSINLGSTVAVHNFGGQGVATYLGGSIKADFVTVTNCGAEGITTTYGGGILANDSTSNNNGTSGILANIGGSIMAVRSYACFNGGNGLFIGWGGSLFAYYSTSSFNASNGCYVLNGGAMGVLESKSSDNGGAGYYVSGGGAIACDRSEALRNATHGIQVYMGGSLTAPGATTYGSVAGPDVYAGIDGTILFAGGNTLSNSPAFNTIGNGKCYIAI